MPKLLSKPSSDKMSQWSEHPSELTIPTFKGLDSPSSQPSAHPLISEAPMRAPTFSLAFWARLWEIWRVNCWTILWNWGCLLLKAHTSHLTSLPSVLWYWKLFQLIHHCQASLQSTHQVNCWDTLLNQWCLLSKAHTCHLGSLPSVLRHRKLKQFKYWQASLRVIKQVNYQNIFLDQSYQLYKAHTNHLARLWNILQYQKLQLYKYHQAMKKSAIWC